MTGLAATTAASERRLVNAPRLAAFLEEAGLDAFVGGSQANVYYLSGYRCWLEPLMREWMMRPGAGLGPVQESFAIATRAGASCLVVGATFAPDALASWVDDVRVWGSFGYDEELPAGELEPGIAQIRAAQRKPAGDDAAQALIGTLRDLGLAEGNIGIDVEGMEPQTVERLRAALPRANLRGCSNLLRVVRMVKSAPELDLLSRCAELNEKAGLATAAAARRGTRVSELRHGFRASVAAGGAEVDHYSPGVAGIGLSTSADHALGDGEVFSIDYGCILDGYFSDAGLTVALGGVAEPLRARYDALRTAIVEVGLEAMRPGVLASSVHDAMREFLAGHGITACFPHGHGLGIELRDYPILVPDTGLRIADDCIDLPADLPLEPGMVINLEVVILLPGAASLEVEVTTLVTSSGARPLVVQDRAAPIGPA